MPSCSPSGNSASRRNQAFSRQNLLALTLSLPPHHSTSRRTSSLGVFFPQRCYLRYCWVYTTRNFAFLNNRQHLVHALSYRHDHVQRQHVQGEETTGKAGLNQAAVRFAKLPARQSAEHWAGPTAPPFCWRQRKISVCKTFHLEVD